MKRRRIWCEYLPPEELTAPATLELLRRFELEPLIAFPPDRDSAAWAAALRRLTVEGLPFGLWPLLLDDDGYWPSDQNAELFGARVESVLAFAEQAGARPRTVAIDLEPPLSRVRPLMQGGLPAARTLYAEARRSFLPAQRTAHQGATLALAGIALRLEQLGIESLAAVLPPILLDLASGHGGLQALFGTPVFGPAFRVVSPMMYTTIIADLLPFGGLPEARALLYEGGRILAAGVGAERGCLSLGLVTTGKLQEESAYDGPELLALDVAAARAAGIDDLALYALEGVLHRGHPERWLLPYTQTDPAPPRPRWSGTTLRTLAQGLGVVRRWR